ncbi:hypothetical protein C8R44DRAFT_724516 [Mycena epipterygia]|nr:hypothetical protein C8R44DRAFT_724516 [Mycena epipterygia]
MHFIKSLASVAVFIAAAAAVDTVAQASFYNPDGRVGKCGTVIQNSDLVVALSSSNYENGAHCGQTITVAYNDVVNVLLVADECVACVEDGLELTSGAFELYAPLSDGLINVTYTLD